ncbi:hypothetical protein ACHAXT_001453 [Thalassiosira profunda]
MARMASNRSDSGDYDVDERGAIGASNHASFGREDSGNFGDNFGGGKDAEGGAPVLRQPVGEGEAGNEIPTFPEGNADDPDREPSRDEGSDISSADKYADRNSDPGVHIAAEADYALPMLPPHHSQGRIGTGPYPENVAMGDPNMGLAHPGGTVPGLHGGNVAMGGGGQESVSLGTATQTHEVRMPLMLSNFKPATGCTNASDFVVRCFVARLRSGITVVKHGRSRWCKSRLRVLHVHPDGRSLSWKPALGEPSSGKRPPKLDLTSCREVRHAWSPDPDNPMFTGTPILRQKCEAANAHKSFALIFPKRTVDITAVTADQCKVLMEGFSALCFRLQVAQNVAGSGDRAQAGQRQGSGKEGDTHTESVTLTEGSTLAGSPRAKKGKKMSFRS